MHFVNRIMTTIIKRITLGLGLLMVGSILLSSCTKNDESTIVLIGTEYYIDDILSVVPDSLQTRFFAAFGSVPKGPVPPKIEGEYVVARKVRVDSNLPGWSLQTVENNTFLRFSRQHNGVVTLNLNEVTESVTDTVFVCGNEQQFAAYYIEDLKHELGRIKRGVVIKGQKTEQGLSDFRFALVIMESEDYSNGQFPPNPVGTYYIYKDEDGLAESFDW